MERRNFVKDLSIFLVIAMIMAHPFPLEYKIKWSLTQSASLTDIHRLTYMIFHANWIHLLINTYSFLALAFLCNVTVTRFLIAVLISALIPGGLLSDIPMLGLSVVNYALTGLVLSQNNKWWWFFTINSLVIGAGCCISGVAVIAHMWGFALGLIIGWIHRLLFTPIFNE